MTGGGLKCSCCRLLKLPVTQGLPSWYMPNQASLLSAEATTYRGVSLSCRPAAEVWTLRLWLSLGVSRSFLCVGRCAWGSVAGAP